MAEGLKARAAIWWLSIRHEWKKYLLYYLCYLAILGWLAWWIPYRHLPWPGVAVAIIAMLAALMSIHADIHPRHKFIYFALMAALLTTEFRAMRKDRTDTQQAQNEWNTKEDNRLCAMLAGERHNTKVLLDQENASLDAILKQDQKAFVSTITTLLSTHKQDEKSFAGVLGKQQQAFEEQRALSEEFHGRLVPDNLPTPPNGCSKGYQPKAGTVLIVSGDNGDITSNFPHTALKIGNLSVISVDRVGNTDDLSLSVDMRDKSNRIAFRMDKNGIVNRSGLIFIHPDRSTFLLQDPFGNEFFRAQYLNPTTFKVSGSISYCGKQVPIQNPQLHDSCFIRAGGAGIYIGLPSCPTQQ